MISDFPWAIGTVDFSADGRWLAVGTFTQVTFCETDRFQKRYEVPIDHWVFDTDISHDGQLIATAGNQGADGEKPGIVKVWDVATGVTRSTLDPKLLSAQHVAFSRDAQRLACSGRAASQDEGEFAVTVWDVAQGRQLLHRRDAETFDFSPDSKDVAMAGRGGAWIERPDGDATSGTLIVARAMHAVRFSPDGQTLAILDAEGQLSLWSKSEAREYVLGRAKSSIRFSADGKRFAAFGESAISIWDVADGRIVSTIPLVATNRCSRRMGGQSSLPAGKFNFGRRTPDANW